MKNIIDLAFELIEKNKYTTTKEIVSLVDNPRLVKMKPLQLEALVYTDLMTDGRFIKINEKWDLKKDHTMKEIIKEQYHSIGTIEDFEEEVIIDDEPQLVISTDDDDDEKLELDRLDEFQELE